MASGPTLPRSASEYHAAQRREIGAALTAVDRQWSLLSATASPDLFRRVMDQILAILLVAQGRVSAPVERYVSDVLAELGLERLDDPRATVATRPLVGATGDGRAVAGLAAVATGKVAEVLESGGSRAAAMAVGGKFLNLATSTLLSDTARQMESLHTAVRPVSGYVRMLNPPSCSRCAILAGREYKWNTGFERHPGCDCRHIPAAESIAGDLTVSPKAYFDSLTTAEQDRIFTKSGAEAIRLGADPAKVVNARRGMSTAQPIVRESGQRNTFSLNILGKQVYSVDEPVMETVTQRRRLARDARGFFTTDEGTARRGRPRLMPESIFEISGGNRQQAMDLLKTHGYIL